MVFAVFETEYGSFEIELLLDQAPLTAGYFKKLISLGALKGSSVFRIVGQDNATLRANSPIEVVQGGLRDTDKQPIPPVRHEPTSETGLTHRKWSVSTARDGPGETYGSFFVCMRDEPALDFGGQRHPDGHGFAVFGAVVSGFEVVESIFAKREPDEFLTKPILISDCRLTQR